MMLFFPVFTIFILFATSLAFPQGIRLPSHTPTDLFEQHADKYVQSQPADRPERVQPLEGAEMLQSDRDILPPVTAQVGGLFKYLQMGDLPSSLDDLFSPMNSGENGKAQFVRSEPIVDIEEDGNFTVTPPERPASAPPFKIP